MSERAVALLEARLPEDGLRSRRIRELYVPSFAWLLEQLTGSPRRPLVAGLSAPQGSGKTTFTRAMVALLEAEGLRAVTLSIDDFYRTRAEQLEVAARHPGNRVLEHRGAPGTHDLDLGEATLEARSLERARAGHRRSVRGADAATVRERPADGRAWHDAPRWHVR